MLVKINHLFRMTRNPEIIQTASGTTICKLGLVCDEKYKDKQTSLFIDAVAFGRGGEVINQHFAKGSQIFISGKLSPNDYEKQDGTKVRGFQIIVESFDFVGKSSGQQDSHNEAKSNGYQPQAEPEHNPDDEIPF